MLDGRDMDQGNFVLIIGSTPHSYLDKYLYKTTTQYNLYKQLFTSGIFSYLVTK